MKLLKYSFFLGLIISIAGVWACDDGSVAPTLDGKWVLISATANGTAIPNPSMTLTLTLTDSDGNGTFDISDVSSDLVTFNGQNLGNYTVSGTTAITFTTGSTSNTASVTSSPLIAGPSANLVVSFNANLDQHNDKDNTSYIYTFQLQ